MDDSILNDLKQANPDTIINLSNGLSFKVSDIVKVSNLITYNDLLNKFKNTIKCYNEKVSLCDFLNEFKRDSTSYIYKQSEPANTTNPIRSNAKFIYQKILLNEPICLTLVELGMFKWILEPMDPIIAWESFISSKRALPDLLKINNSQLITFDQLDKSFKDMFLKADVSIKRITPLKIPNLEYINTVSTLFNIPQKDQELLIKL